MDGDTPDINAENAVAIIGMACRLPGAANVTEFWNNLVNGVESLTTFTDEELLESGVSPDLVQSPNYVKSRGIIDGAGDFDATFFGFTPRDAQILDPQQRIFLECAWHALEDGGYIPGKTDARIAVFGGVGTNWHLGDVSRHPAVKKFANAASVVTSNDKDYVTTRVSYKLNLTGPSVNVQCACSTSMVSALLGAASLTSYQCDLVLAGGATIEIPEKKGYLYQEGGMDSAGGHCRPFDAGADGTVFSRGAGVVLLKRLADAIADGDTIHAVILDGAINNDGSGKVGFTAPSVNGQVEVGIEAFERVGVKPESVSFVEAHGTATALGDPVEVASLSQVFSRETDRKQFCAIGSVKGNIGHTDVAAGAASLIKVALSLKHGTLPASINYDTPNPEIDFPNSPFFVNTDLRDLPRGDGPLRGLINSFGVGGTNACAIVQEPPAVERSGQGRATNVLLFAAKTETALKAMTAAAADHVAANPDLDLDDLAFTSQVGRADFPHRRHVVVAGRADLLDRLTDRKPGGRSHALCPAEPRPVVFAFPGQGNQYVGMGADLYASEPAFREAMDAVCEALRPVLDVDLREILYATGDAVEAATQRLNDTDVTQPALFATSYAMAKLFLSWGIQPGALIGHSVGEYVAAVLAGVLSLEDGAKAVARRGQLIQALPRGSMLAILQPESDVAKHLTPGLSVAAVNSPQLTVVAGPTPDIENLEAKLKETGIFATHLDTSHAFHSSMMDPALPEFADVLATISLAPPTVPIVSTVTGGWMTDEQATDPDYWVQHVRRPVRFADGLMTLLNGPESYIVLECGPGHSLASAAKSQLTESSPHTVVTSMGSQSDPGLDHQNAIAAVGALWAAGRPIEWSTLYKRQPRRVSMPGYPFERERYVLTGADFAEPAVRKNDQKNPDMGAWFYLPAFRRTVAPELLTHPVNPDEGKSADCWLILADGAGVASAMTARIRAAGGTVVTVRQGTAFEQLDAHAWVLRPGVSDDYHELMGSLKQADTIPDRVVHLWNVQGANGLPDLEAVAEGEGLAFYSPLFLEQALVKRNLIDGVRLLVAANGVFDVAGEGVQDPVKALAVGPARVFGRELPGVHGRFVDVDIPDNAEKADQLAAHFMAEANLVADETVAAYRNGYRWVESFEPVRLEEKDGLAPSLRKDGVYLITGGLGGLGLILAQKIAEQVGGTLILTHRASVPVRGDWDAWLSDHPGADSTSERIRGVQALESAGATVVLAQADSGDLAAMRQVVGDAIEQFGEIHGVLHAAGTAGSGIISLKTPEMAADVLRAKVRGTLILDQLFQDTELDFFVLFSSITSILGEAGRVDYCAANSFLDSLAQYLWAKRPWAAVSINWPSWAGSGMAARWEQVKSQRGLVPVARDGDEPQLRFAGAEGEEESYDVLVDPELDWAISSHAVFGIPTMVGVGFLDLMVRYAALKKPGSTPVMENAYFISPLMFEPNVGRRVRLFVRDIGGKHRFSFKSQRMVSGGVGGPWHEHFRGDVRLEQQSAASTIDIGGLVARFDGEIDDRPFLPEFEWTGPPPLSVGPRWNSMDGLRIGDGEWLAKLELPAEFAAEMDSYPYHPALMDVALAAAAKCVVNEVFLPTGYGRVHLKAPLTASLWSHIRLNGEAGPDADTMAFDVTILDPDGRELAEVSNYSLKRVTATGPAPSKADVSSAKSSSTNSTDLLPDEGVEAFARILAAPFFPQVVVCTRDLDGLIKEENDTGVHSDKSDDEDAAEAPTHARPSLSTPYKAPANAIEEAIAEIWQGILGMAQVGANDDFTELGGNSLLAVQAVANTADAFSIDLPIDAFFKSPTVRGLAEAVVELLVSMASEDTLEEMISELDEA